MERSPKAPAELAPDRIDHPGGPEAKAQREAPEGAPGGRHR